MILQPSSQLFFPPGGVRMGEGRAGGAGANFDLRDDFLSDLAAGSVHGTDAAPGPGTRTVVDTENKLSIAGSVLSFAGQKTVAAYGNPGYWLDAITRGAGKVVCGSLVTPSVNTKEFLVGLGVAQSGFTNDSAIYFAVSNGLAIFESGAGRTVGAWATSTVYRWAIVLRAAGAFYFVKGGAYGDWTLMHISHLNNTATLYPEIVNYNAVFTASTIRKPQSTYTPVPLISDGFTRANGAIGVSDGAGNPEGGGSGVAWNGSTATIATNKAIITPTEGAEQSSGALVVGTWYRITATDADHFYTGCAINDTFRSTATTALDATNKVVALSLPTTIATMEATTPNVWLDINMAALTAKTQGGIIARADSASNPQNFILAEYDGAGNIKIFDCVAGVYTQTRTVVKAFAANNRLLMRVNGTKVKLWWVSGNTWTAIADDITTSVTTGNIHGMFSTAASNTFDNAVIWAAGAEGQHVALNGFFNGVTTKTFLAIGDSKTACTSGISWEWQMSNYPARLELMELPARIAADGWKVISPGMDAYLAAASGTPDYAFINFGANDLDVTSEADYKSYYLSHLDKLKAKYPNIQCYLTKVWKRGRDASCDTMATWIDYIVSQRPTFAHVGDDERVWMENGDDGVTYTADGTHPNAAGYALAAAKKREAIGY